ncbi:transketolase family protein [Actinomyces sp. B33]|uniref:transketolase family protein n=1 Tax=Actinomyces sp. B33 TaxID=2942131 RepID=UPI002340A472|nr:transketolase C-terminal domain-containing protein [Actinomyces sp. B33]MDC4233334.1 transketolase family protein [Actinomyces sp. B33]
MKYQVNYDDKLPTRNAFGDEIVELGKERPEVYVVDCDIAKSCQTTAFSKALPDQHVNVGIAEQNGAGVAAGLATTGKIPFVVTYAVFGSLRMAEQIRQSICYPNLNVKIACSHGGLTPGNDGGSHQAIEDMGTMRGLPGMTVVMPADYHSTRKLVREAADWEGPMFLRFTRDAVPAIYGEDEVFEIGKAKVLGEGDDVAIIANGDTVRLAIEAAERLEAEGVSVRLVDMHTIKPLDREEVLRCIETGRIVTTEDHTIMHGLGAAVSQVVAEVGGARVRQIGIQDQFGQSATYEELLEMNGITVDGIVAAAKELLA